MTELEWALNNASAKGFDICKDYMQQSIPMVGFRLPKKHVYHWFKIGSEGWLLFDHAYSMNTGKTTRGRVAWMRATSLFLPV